MNWLMPANEGIYDYAGAFQKWGFIDWRQNNRKYQVNDIIYIYCTRPYQKIMYKTRVERVGLSANEIIDDSSFWTDKNEYSKSLSGKYARLKLVEQVNTSKLSLDRLIDNGLSRAPQSSIKITKHQLISYIEKYMNDNFHEDVFPDSADTNSCPEGAKIQVYVNKYERSSFAREKCIEYHGCECKICGINFEKVYGEIGKGFIHVHHIIPLNEIDKEYIVDYKKDLIPVCPNCHAMLHRKHNGQRLSIEKLKKELNK